MYRRAATYVDEIFHGRQACRLAGRAADEIRVCHQPQTAKAIGLEVPPSLLARADEVIE